MFISTHYMRLKMATPATDRKRAALLLFLAGFQLQFCSFSVPTKTAVCGCTLGNCQLQFQDGRLKLQLSVVILVGEMEGEVEGPKEPQRKRAKASSTKKKPKGAL